MSVTPAPATFPGDRSVSGDQAPTGARRAFTAVLLAICATAAFPFYLTLSGGMTLRSPDVLTLAALVLLGIAHLRGVGLRLERTPIDIPMAALWATLLVSWFWADDTGLYLRALRPWVASTVFFYLLVPVVRDGAGAHRVMRLVLVGLCGQALVATWQLFAGKEGMYHFLGGWGGYFLYEADVIESRLTDFYFNWNIAEDDLIRVLGISVTPSGTCINATTFATLMAVLAAVALFSWGRTRASRNVVALVGVVAILLALLSLKRSGWVAMAAPFLFLPLLGRRELIRAGRILGIASLVVAGVIAFFPAVGYRLADRGRSAFMEFRVTPPKPPAASTAAAKSGPVLPKDVGAVGPGLPETVHATVTVGENRLSPTAGALPWAEGTSAPRRGSPGLSADQPRHEQGRISLWRYTIDSIWERPFTGVGLGQWPLHGPWTLTRYGVQRWGNTESFFLGLMAEVGLFGLVAFLSLVSVLLLRVGHLIRTGHHQAQLACAAGAGLMATVFGGAVNSLFPADHIWPLFFTFAAIIIAIGREPAPTHSQIAARTGLYS